MPNLFKSGNTATNGCIYKGNFTIGVNTSLDYGPTSATSFWNGISSNSTSGNGGGVYQNKSSGGPSIQMPNSDAALLTTLQRMGATGSTLANALGWAIVQPDIMVSNVDYPSIVTSGLTFLVDASYTSSYPRQGLIWYDLSGNGNHPSFNLNPTFSASTLNGGALNSLNPCASSTATNVTGKTQYTLGAFIFFMGPNSTSGSCVIGTRSGTTVTNGPNIWVSGSSANQRIGFNNIDYGPVSAQTGSWKYFVGTQDATTQRFYIDGTLVSTQTAASPTLEVNQIFIGAYFSTGLRGNLKDANLGNLHIYDRPLSATEISNNNTVLRARYLL